MSSREQLAAASTGAIASRYSTKPEQWRQAMQEIQDSLARYRIPAERINEVLSQAAARYLSTDGGLWYAAEALQLLVDAGAIVDRARTIKGERDGKPRLRIGDAQL